MFQEWVDNLSKDIILDVVSRLDIQGKGRKNAIYLSNYKTSKKAPISEGSQEPEREQED